MRMIDLGCGNGRDSVFFAKHRISVIAIDQVVSEIDFLNENEGLMVGGDYRGDSLTNINAAYTTDAGRSWFPLRAEHKPKGYRSGVAFLQNGGVLAIGREAGDEKFTAMEGQYYTVSTTKNGESAWASGAQGRVARLGWR